MDVDGQARLVQQLADLAGWVLAETEARQVVHRAVTLTREEANAIWALHRSDPPAVDPSAYLAMTLKFVLMAQHQPRT